MVILRRMSSGDSREIVVTSAVRTPTGKSNLYDLWGQNLERVHRSEPFLLTGISLDFIYFSHQILLSAHQMMLPNDS